MSSETATLNAVAAVIESISGVGASELTADTDLLDLGLDSLMFVRIGRVLEERYQVSISMKRFYDELSQLGTLAAYLATNGSVAADTSPAAPVQASLQQAAQPPALQTSQASSPAASREVSRDGAHVAAHAASHETAQRRVQQVAALPAGTATEVDAVMAAHLALMRRYLDGVAAGRHEGAAAGTTAVAAAATRPATAAARMTATTPGTTTATQRHDQADAVATRRKFSGIVTQREELTAQQRGFIDQLAQRLSQRCARSKQMAESGKTHLSDWKYSLQFKQDLKELRFPVVCEHAAGARFTDVDGNEYIDIAMGMGVHYFGHSPQFVDAAVRAQLDSNLALGPQSKLAPEVARRICALTGHERAAFFVTGSDAVMLALRLVRAARARNKVVLFAGAYHGICSDILAGQGEDGAVPMSPGLPPGIVSDLVVLDYDAPESLDAIRRMADDLAGVLVEPVQSRNPALQPQRFLRRLRALCSELQIPLIFDEMVNGFRQAPGGMQQWFGVEADLSTYGKIIGGGYPLSVIAGKSWLMQWIDGGLWRYGDDSAPHADSIATGGTHNKHPVALAAAAAVLDHIEANPQLFHDVRMRMHGLGDRLNVWFERNAVPLRLTWFGTQFKFENFASALELELFFYLLQEQGIYTWELHVANLSTAHTAADLDQLYAAVVHAVQALRAGGFAFRAERLRRQYFPMSSVQRRIYALTQREGAERPYHLAGCWRLRGAVDAARLEDCIHQVIIRHEALRTAFVVADGEFWQRIVPEPRFFLDRVQLQGRTPEQLLEDYIQPFNLLEPPLLRVALAELGPDEQLLLLDVHHIAADGLSMNVVLQEILALYDGVALPPVRRQARQVQDSVAQYLATPAAQAAAQYWRETLAPFVATQDSFDLSPDFNRPPVTSFAGHRLVQRLDADFTAALHRFCSAERTSTFATLFAVFVVWLWHYARQSRFVVGLPGSGRPDNEADAAVGMFVNTLAFPAEVEAQMPVAGFLRSIRDRLFEVQEHGDYPFGELLQLLQVQPSPNRNPLFDTMFSYENAGSREIRSNSFSGETLAQYEGAGMFDLSFDLIETEASILINCAGLASLFSTTTLQRRLDDYVLLLRQLVTAAPATLAEWVATVGSTAAASEPAAVSSIVARWQQQAQASAQQVALLDGERRLDYGTAAAEVQELAFTLFNRFGVRAGDRVLVSLDGSIDLVLALLALFTLGAVYVPVTPDTPLLRVRSIQRQCGARHLIHAEDSAFAAALAQQDAVECMTLAAIRAQRIATTRHQRLPPPQSEDVAYVLFTSGSTGEPKGVEVLHGGIANAVDWRIHAYAMGPQDCTLQMPSAAFDASIIDILSTLLCGGRLLLIDTAARRSVERIRDCIVQHRVSNLLLTPTLYRVLLDRIPQQIASLRFITLAGEKLPLDLVQAHFAQVPAVELWNEYGPTECSVVVSGGRQYAGQQRVTIGAPVSNTRIYILDEQLRPTPAGVWGRLWVGGRGVARGYAGNAAATEQRFRRLAVAGDQRCYDTGDIARLLDNGELEFKGRDDGQVKVNGYRIELEDVEAALRSSLQLREVAAAVVAKDNSASLHGWVVAEQLPPDWRQRLQAVLPQWMVPGALHCVTQLPLLPSGKLNRLALVPPAEAVQLDTAPQAAAAQPAAMSAVLELLLRLCRDVLGRPTLAAQDHYFNAGGDSIQAILLASRLHESGYLLDVNDVFQYPVLAELALRIRALDAAAVLPRAAQSASAILPTPLQQWCFDTCRGDLNAFTQAAWLQLPAAIMLQQLELLCRHWAAQHAVFAETRALMARRAGRAADTAQSAGPQRSAGNAARQPDATSCDIAALLRCTQAAADVDHDALAVAARAAIDLESGPLLNVVLVPDAAQPRALVVFHHFLVDAVSWQLLQTQWALLWDDLQQGRPLRPLPEPAGVQDYAASLHAQSTQQRIMQELPLWQALAYSTPPLLTTADATASSTAEPAARHAATATLEPELVDVLLGSGHAQFRSRGGELLLAVFVDAVARVFGGSELTVLMEAHGRAQRHAAGDFSATLGWLTSAYPLSFDTSDSAQSDDWADKVERLRDVVQRVPEQGVGYGVLRHLLQHPALPAVAPEFAFNYLGRFQQGSGQAFAILDDSVAGDRMGELGLLPPFEFVCFADTAGLHLQVTAAAAQVSTEQLARFMQTYAQQAASLVQACAQQQQPVACSAVDCIDTRWRRADYLALLEAHELPRTSVENIVPLTPMQTGLLFHARQQPQDLAYLEQVDFTLQGVEAERLGRAFQRLLQRFPLLRVAFLVGSGGQSAQVVRRDVSLPLQVHDLSALPPERQQEQIAAARQADRARQFDITQAPLMRVQLFILQPASHAAGSKLHVIWTHHHLIMDGWCVGVLFDELIDCYRNDAAAAAEAAPGACNEGYFRWLATRDREAATGWWRELLAGVEQATPLLPWSQVRTTGGRNAETGTVAKQDTRAADDYRLRRHAALVPEPLVAALQSLAAGRNATLSSVLRLAWGVLLARFNNVDDVVFGTVVSGRPAEVPGIERAVGLFINTVPVRFRLQPQLSAHSALSQLQAQANASRAHEYLSLAEIQAAAPQLRARAALFDHLVVFENYPMDAALRGAAASDDAATTPFGIADIQAWERTDLPLNVVIVPQGKALELGFLFDEAVYPAAQIEHLAQHLVLLLQALVAAPDKPLVELDLLTAQEQAWLHDSWNARAAAYPQDVTLFDLFRQAAQAHPQRTAISDEHGRLSYAELLAQVQAVATALHQRAGCGVGQRVALWLPRNREMIIGMLAVAAAGAAYVALDPIYPTERLRFIVQDSGAVLLLGSTQLPQQDFGITTLQLAELVQTKAQPTLPAVAQDAMAYVCYTSGSTGQPKGCAISHRNVVRLLRNDRFDFDFDHNDVWVLAHSFCFDFSVWEMYGALLNGGRLVIPAADQVRNVESFVALVAQQRVTVLNQTPAAFYQFARLAVKAGAPDLSALRLVIFGGDALASARLVDWIDAFPPSRVKLVNMYGITETTVHVSYKEVTAAEIRSGSSPNLVGRPLPETQVWIVDRNGRLQPPGIAGEIVVGGSGVGGGYLGRPELTARKFAPLLAAGSARCYWSGDVGLVDPALGLVYLGRNDHQVQVRGFRVECDEVARCFEAHQSVSEAVVLPIENAHGTELVAYLCGDATAAPAQWRAWLAQRLPDYMIPAHTLWLPRMPLTGNGKLDRAALPDPLAAAAAEPSAAPDAGNNQALEQLIIAAWQQVLGHERVTAQSNFFDAGGHSLKALTLADLLQTAHGLDISVNDIFEYPTPRQQAALCANSAVISGTASDELDALIAEVGADDLAALLDSMDDGAQDG